ncbi:MAG: hypothetical protein JWM33_3904 [Caulobacteraceae bacterium]|nr:hypothetical protein [Caulobacteraceae bacterium]
MGRFSIIAALVLGVLLGAGGVLAWTQLRPSDDRDLTSRRPAQFSQPRLAERLMARVARKLVAVRSPQAPMSGGAVLFDAPQVYGGVLCSVRAYAFPTPILRGRRDPADPPWEDDLKITERYSVWKEPGAPAPPGLTAAIACAGLHDFQHLILGDGPAVERDVALLDRAIREARAGTPGFSVTCADRRQDKPITCDGLDLLRRASVRQIRQVGGDWDGGGASRADHLDMVFMEPPDKAQTLTFQLHSTQQPSGDDALHAIEIARDRIG